MNSAVRSRDSYKTENAEDGKAKSRDTRATNCEAETRERPANLFILALPCRCRHASLGFTYVSFSRWLFHTNPFSHSYISTTRAHCILDKTYGHVMHTGCIDPTLSLSMPPMTQLRLAPNDDYHLSSIYYNMEPVGSLGGQGPGSYSTATPPSENPGYGPDRGPRCAYRK